MKALSEDLRVRVVEARQAGESIAEVAERFSVSLSSVKRLHRQIREQGRLDFRSPPGRPACFEGDTLDAFAAQLREHNDWTLTQRTGPMGRRGSLGGPPREVAQLGQDSAVFAKTVPFCPRLL